jgi:glutaredoxin
VTAPRQHEIVLFSAGFCEFSEMVRLHLESRGQRYIERDIDTDPAARDDMLKLGAAGTPVTVIDGEVVIGYDDAAIDELLGFEPYNPPQDLSGEPIADPDHFLAP